MYNGQWSFNESVAHFFINVLVEFPDTKTKDCYSNEVKIF